MQHSIFALWAHPRSLSTAMERIFIERGDLHIIHEPFSTLYYLTEGKGTASASTPNPEVPENYTTIRDQIITQAASGPVFFKDMPYHCFDHIQHDEAFLRQQTPIFLIREPAAAIESHYAKNPEVTLEEIGYELQFRLFEMFRKMNGTPPVVVKAEALQEHPENTIRDLCQTLNLDFIPEAMQWQKETRKEWKTWEKWHQEAANSTGIRQTKKKYEVTIENNATLKAYYDHHLPFYQAMLDQCQMQCE